MFSLTELDDVAWLLLLLMVVWVVVNVLVDLSSDRAVYRDPKKSTDEQREQRD